MQTKVIFSFSKSSFFFCSGNGILIKCSVVCFLNTFYIFLKNHTTRVDRCRLLRWKHNIIVLTSQEGHLRDLYNLDQSVADHQDLGFGMDRWKCQQALDWKLGMDSIWIPGMEIWIRWNYQCGQVLLCVKYSHPSMDLFTQAWIFQQAQWLTLWWCQYLDILEVLITFVCDGENCKNALSDPAIDHSNPLAWLTTLGMNSINH